MEERALLLLHEPDQRERETTGHDERGHGCVPARANPSGRRLDRWKGGGRQSGDPPKADGLREK
jgi:hypothetical protein